MVAVAQYEVFVRDAAYQRVDQLGAWLSLTCVMRFNAVGSWEMEVSRSAPGAELLGTDGGIIVIRDDVTIFSGRVTSRVRTATTIQYGGVDDMALLETPTRPTPATAAAPYADDYYVITDRASTVMLDLVNRNIGPGAPAAWKIAALQLSTDNLLGGTITARTRLDRLVDYLAQLAVSPLAGGLHFTLMQSDADPDALVFSVKEARDKSDTVFSIEAGTAANVEDAWESPGANYVYVLGGDGFGNDRTIIEQEDSAAVLEAGRRITAIVDARGTVDTGELYQRAAEALTGASAARRLQITPQEVPSLVYGDDYDLGDTVTAVIEDETNVYVIREISLEIGNEGGARVTPTLGGPGMSNDDLTSRQIASVERRLENLEINWGVPDGSISYEMLTDALAALLDLSIPKAGDVRPCAKASPTTGWLFCQGQSLLRASYPALFSAIGTTFGAADSAHFNLPDARGRFLIGAGGVYSLGATGGATTVDANHTHASQAHTHPGSHSHGAGTIAIAHTHASQAHTHPGSHSHGAGTLAISHDHTVDIDHNHAAFSSGLTNNDTVAVGHASLGSGASDHHHQVDVPALGTTSKTTSTPNNISRSGSTDTDSNVFDATYTGSPSGVGSPSNSGSTDADSNVFAASYSGSPSAASPSLAALSVLNPYLGMHLEIYTAA